MPIEKFPTHIEIATRQLACALDLYLNGGDLICAITLAGAAEEILGALAKESGKSNSVEKRADRTRELYKFLFPDAPDVSRNVFIRLKNEVRNMMKHKKEPPTSGMIDLDRHAGLMIKRAIENYEVSIGVKTKQMRDFEAERLNRIKVSNT